MTDSDPRDSNGPPAMSSSETPLQLPLEMLAPAQSVRITLELRGLRAVATCEDTPGMRHAMLEYLQAAGVTLDVASGDDGRVSFPVVDLPNLAALPPRVHLDADATLEPLLLLAQHPPQSGQPVAAVLPQGPDGEPLDLGWLELQWAHQDHTGELVQFEEPAGRETLVALMASDVPFNATAQAWDLLEQLSTFPIVVGRARVNSDNFVELAATKPQIVEAAPLPGMFRLDGTHFGLPLAYAHVVDDLQGFEWNGPAPRLQRPPNVPAHLPVELSDHHRQDLSDLVRRLAQFRAAAVVWESGLGKRIFALAACEVLDAWPLLIVAPPWQMWAWQRHLDLLGRSGSLRHNRADARLVTYLDLAQGVDLATPVAVLFDNLAATVSATPRARRALHLLDNVSDAYRLAVDSSWPGDLAESCRIADLLRPGEFRFDVPLEVRYPGQTKKRAAEHLDVYVSRRRKDDPDTADTNPFTSPFRRSQVKLVTVPDTQRRELGELRSRFGQGQLEPLAALAEALEVTSAGAANSLSPKVVAAAQLAKAGARAGRSVAVATAHRRAANAVALALRPWASDVQDLRGAARAEVGRREGRVSVVLFARLLPDLRQFDEVVLVDYPFSFEAVEQAVGSAYAANGPQQVTVLHAPGTVDDRLAMFAARRRELAAVSDPSAPPSAEEAKWLLAPRWDDGTTSAAPAARR